ncbi:serine-rich adhesin for platelets isoform X2 [Hyalella azteca]|uniref:Serine-rich adhesin for platelets isoform X2 n=1 Tax=Hyalella azteca TaxID=294128 RepID=A0A979FJ98_HYAAZ|nr:serine-rich adhesin for platelets isoform X2 [Hyalella azteca]
MQLLTPQCLHFYSLDYCKLHHTNEALYQTFAIYLVMNPAHCLDSNLSSNCQKRDDNCDTINSPEIHSNAVNTLVTPEALTLVEAFVNTTSNSIGCNAHKTLLLSQLLAKNATIPQLAQISPLCESSLVEASHFQTLQDSSKPCLFKTVNDENSQHLLFYTNKSILNNSVASPYCVISDNVQHSTVSVPQQKTYVLTSSNNCSVSLPYSNVPSMVASPGSSLMIAQAEHHSSKVFLSDSTKGATPPLLSPLSPRPYAQSLVSVELSSPSILSAIPTVCQSSVCDIDSSHRVLSSTPAADSTYIPTSVLGVSTCSVLPGNLVLSGPQTNGVVAGADLTSSITGGRKSPMASPSSTSLSPVTSSLPLVSSKNISSAMTVSGGGGKHALRQQARRRRRNTSIAAGNSPPITRITMKTLSGAQQLCGASHVTTQQQLSTSTPVTSLLTLPTSLPLQHLQQLHQAHLDVSAAAPVITLPLTTNGLSISSAGVIFSNSLSAQYSTLLSARPLTKDILTSTPLSPSATPSELRNASPGILFNACKSDVETSPVRSFHSSIGSDLSSIVNSAINSVVTISARNSSNTRLSPSPLASRNANTTLKNLVANSKSFTLSNKSLLTYSNNAKNKSCISKQLSVNKVSSTKASTSSAVDSNVSLGVTSKQSTAPSRTPRSSQRSSSRLAWTSIATPTTSLSVTHTTTTTTTHASTSSLSSTTSTSLITTNPSSSSASSTVTIVPSTTAVPCVTPPPLEVVCCSSTTTPNLSPSLASTCALTGRALRVSSGQSSPSSLTAAPSTMQDYLAAIPGFKPRKKSGRKLSTAAQLAQSKEGNIDLETPDSILCGVNLRPTLNNHTFTLLSPEQQARLMPLMPQLDLENVGSVKRLASGSLNNEFFGRACESWRCRLNAGEFTHDSQMKMKAEVEKERLKLDPWKVAHFEPVWGVKPSAQLPPLFTSPAFSSGRSRGFQSSKVSSNAKLKNSHPPDKLLLILKLLAERESSRKKASEPESLEDEKIACKLEDDKEACSSDCLIIPSNMLMNDEDSNHEDLLATRIKAESFIDRVDHIPNSSIVPFKNDHAVTSVSCKRKNSSLVWSNSMKKMCLSSIVSDAHSRKVSDIELIAVSSNVSSSLRAVSVTSNVTNLCDSSAEEPPVVVPSSSDRAIMLSSSSSESIIRCTSPNQPGTACSTLDSLSLTGEVNIVRSDCTITRVTAPGGSSGSSFASSVPGLVLRSSAGRSVGLSSPNTVTIKPSLSSHPTRLSARLSGRNLRPTNTTESTALSPQKSSCISLPEFSSESSKCFSNALSSQTSLQSLQSSRSHLTIEQLPSSKSITCPVSYVSALPQVTIHPVPPKTTAATTSSAPHLTSTITFTRLNSALSASTSATESSLPRSVADVSSAGSLLVIRKIPSSVPQMSESSAEKASLSNVSVNSSRPIAIIPYQQPTSNNVPSAHPTFATPPVLLRGLRLFRIAEPITQASEASCSVDPSNQTLLVPRLNTSACNEASPQTGLISSMDGSTMPSAPAVIDVVNSNISSPGNLFYHGTPPRAASVPPNKTSLVTVSPRPNSVGPQLMLASPCSHVGDSQTVHLVSPSGILLTPNIQDQVTDFRVPPQTIIVASRSPSTNTSSGHVTIANPAHSAVDATSNIINVDTNYVRSVSSSDTNTIPHFGTPNTLITSVPGSHFLSKCCPSPDEDRGLIRDEQKEIPEVAHEISTTHEDIVKLHSPVTDVESIAAEELPLQNTEDQDEKEELPRGHLQLRFSKSQLERFREESSARSVASDDLSEYTDKNTDVFEDEDEEEIEEDEEDEDEDEEEEDVDFSGLTNTEFAAEQFQHLTEQEQLQLKQLQEQQIQLERQIEQQQQLLQLQQQHQAQLQYLGDPDEDQHGFVERLDGYDDHDDRSSGHYSLKRSIQNSKEQEVYDVEDDDEVAGSHESEAEHEIVELHDEDDDGPEDSSKHQNLLFDGENVHESSENIDDNSMVVNSSHDIDMLDSNDAVPTVVDLDLNGTESQLVDTEEDKSLSAPPGDSDDAAAMAEVMEVAFSDKQEDTDERQEEGSTKEANKRDLFSNTVSSMSLRSSRRVSINKAMQSSSDRSKGKKSSSSQAINTTSIQDEMQLEESHHLYDDSNSCKEDETPDSSERQVLQPGEQEPSQNDSFCDKEDIDCVNVAQYEVFGKDNKILCSDRVVVQHSPGVVKGEDDEVSSLPDLDDCNHDMEELGSLQNIDDCLSTIESLENLEDCPSNLNSLDQIDDYPSNIDSFENIDECPSNIDSLDQIDDLPSTIDSPNNLDSFPDEETRQFDNCDGASGNLQKENKNTASEDNPVAVNASHPIQDQGGNGQTSEVCQVKTEDLETHTSDMSMIDDAGLSQSNVSLDESENKLENPESVELESHEIESCAMDAQEGLDVSPSSADGDQCISLEADAVRQQQHEPLMACAVVKQEMPDIPQQLHFTGQSYVSPQHQQHHQFQQMKPLPQQHMMMYGKQFINCNPGGMQPMIYNMNAVMPSHMNNQMMTGHMTANNMESAAIGSNGLSNHVNMGHMIQVVGSNVMRPNMANAMMTGHVIGPNQRFPGFFNNMQQNMNSAHMHMHNPMHMNLNNVNSHANMNGMQPTVVNGGNGTMMNMGSVVGPMGNQNFVASMNVNKFANSTAVLMNISPPMMRSSNNNVSPPAIRTSNNNNNDHNSIVPHGMDDTECGGQVDDGSADDGCPCNMKAMVVCLKCGAFCHHDCMSPGRLCGTCLVR